MSATKAGLRREALARRAGLSAQQRAGAERALVEAVLPRATGPVAAYVSVGTEPATAALLSALMEAAVPVLLPVLLPDGELDWTRYDGAVVPGRRGLLEPTGPRLGPAAVAQCCVVVVPALAVDRSGTRLGRGGGSYDRALTRTSALLVAALHHGDLVETLPAEPHDVPVDAVVLPGLGLMRLPAYEPDLTGDGRGQGL